MFDVYCPTCSGRRLIFSGQMRGLANDAQGIHVGFVCWCGRAGTWSAGRDDEQVRVTWAAAPARDPEPAAA
ncbi:MAG TPA: hypothetical protein VK894_08710 [Jiangellales bacterium]|nr:hypothetical protein [Jiangellales bacterium]